MRTCDFFFSVAPDSDLDTGFVGLVKAAGGIGIIRGWVAVGGLGFIDFRSPAASSGRCHSLAAQTLSMAWTSLLDSQKTT